ncbi:hypothetical protein TNCV_923761 [Trichonephila clavipes]|nr:hypothetical protein TNCV_923761 [Trichonephila clavipes]
MNHSYLILTSRSKNSRTNYCNKLLGTDIAILVGKLPAKRTATAGSDVVQSGSPIFDDFFQHLIVQFRNEKVSNHGSIPITIDCNVVAFIVFEEGFHQPINRTKQSVFLDVTVFRHTLVD